MPGAPPKHPAVMALTRSMTARLQAQALATETFSTPVKIPRTTSSPCTSASSLSPSPSPSPRKLPMPPPRPQKPIVCEVCRNSINFINSSSSSINSSSSLNNRQISTSYNLNVFSNQVELIINNISKLEESINDHIAIINQLEHEIAIISNKLDKLSSSSSRSKPLVTVLSSADLNVNVPPSSSQYTLTFFPRIDLPSVSSEPHVRQPSFSPPLRPHPPPTHHNLPRSRPNLPPFRLHLPRTAPIIPSLVPILSRPAVELTLPDCTKIIITTCYRIGTLGVANCNQIMQTLNKLRRKKMLRKFLVIADLNLKSINWSTGTSEIALETEFVNGFAELGLVQCIDAATDNKGNILDVLLTKSKHYISDIKIIDTARFCISDHYAIRFNIKHRVYCKTRTKRTCFNYKNARWENLNNDLNTINWDSLLDFQEPEAAWKN